MSMSRRDKGPSRSDWRRHRYSAVRERGTVDGGRQIFRSTIVPWVTEQRIPRYMCAQEQPWPPRDCVCRQTRLSVGTEKVWGQPRWQNKWKSRRSGRAGEDGKVVVPWEALRSRCSLFRVRYSGRRPPAKPPEQGSSFAFANAMSLPTPPRHISSFLARSSQKTSSPYYAAESAHTTTVVLLAVASSQPRPQSRHPYHCHYHYRCHPPHQTLQPTQLLRGLMRCRIPRIASSTLL